MSVYGVTKNTACEDLIRQSEEGEANGSVIYQALALMAREQGLAMEAEIFTEIANMEAMHSGFYAVMNGKYPLNFWDLVAKIQQLEANADSKMPEMIAKVRALGTPEAEEAAHGMELIMMEERFHGEILKNLIAKHQGSQAGSTCPVQQAAAAAEKAAAAAEKAKAEAAKAETPVAQKIYVCKVCGYEYVGDINEEPDDYVCPICRKGKEYFVEKQS